MAVDTLLHGFRGIPPMFPVLVELVLELTSASVLCKITIVVASNLREPLTVYSEKTCSPLPA